MSLIGKTPFIKSIFGSLSAQEMQTLTGLVNDLGPAAEVRLFGPSSLIGDANKGVSHVNMALSPLGPTYDGILCYHDESHCGLFVFNDGLSEMLEFSIDPIARTYHAVYEHLSAEEFRRCLDDVKEGGGDAWVEKMKPHLDYSEAGGGSPAKVECGTNMQVDGKVMLNELWDLTDNDGESFIPDPTGHVGAVLTHITTGLAWENVSVSRGSQLEIANNSHSMGASITIYRANGTFEYIWLNPDETKNLAGIIAIGLSSLEIDGLAGYLDSGILYNVHSYSNNYPYILTYPDYELTSEYILPVDCKIYITEMGG